MSNENNDFLIVKRLKNFCFNIDDIVINFPKKELIIRERLLSDSLNILNDVYYINLEKDKDKRIEYKKSIISKFNMLDFYIEYLLKKGIINKKTFDKICRELNDICRMVYGWFRSESRTI